MPYHVGVSSALLISCAYMHNVVSTFVALCPKSFPSFDSYKAFYFILWKCLVFLLKIQKKVQCTLSFFASFSPDKIKIELKSTT